MYFLFLADGFEEIEALATVDVLRRAGIEIKTVRIGENLSSSENKEVKGANEISVIADLNEEEFINILKNGNLDGLILPGGMPGTANLNNSDLVLKSIRYCQENNKLIAAICAAPMILGEMRLLENKEAVCYPGFEKNLHGATISKNSVCVQDNIITAKGPGVALEFGMKIVEFILSKEKANMIKSSMMCNF